jgi:hypothetical protein
MAAIATDDPPTVRTAAILFIKSPQAAPDISVVFLLLWAPQDGFFRVIWQAGSLPYPAPSHTRPL